MHCNSFLLNWCPLLLGPSVYLLRLQQSIQQLQGGVDTSDCIAERENNRMETESTKYNDVAAPEVSAHGKKRDYGDYEASCKRSEDSRKIQELEARLNALTVVGDWRLEQLKAMDSEKRAAEKILEEERKLFAEMSLDQIRQNTAQIQALQEHWFTIMNRRNADGNTLGFQQSPIASASCQSSVSKLERSLDGVREQLKLRSDERDKWKTKSKKVEEEACGAQQQIKKLSMELQRCKAESVKLVKAQSEEKNVEEVCRDLLEQVEQRNIDLQRCRAECKGQYQLKLAELRQKIHERDEEIQKLKGIIDDHNVKRPEVTECIICMDEFGAEPERQRTHWKDCNHANVCYKCTNTLWSSKKRKCPSCNTPASSMPSRLPPNIYL